MCLSTPKCKVRYKDKFYDELVHEWKIKGIKELTLGIGDFNGHVGKKVDAFESVQDGIGE